MDTWVSANREQLGFVRGNGSRQGGDDDAARLGLPVGIDDTALVSADVLVVPVDGQSKGSETVSGQIKVSRRRLTNARLQG